MEFTVSSDQFHDVLRDAGRAVPRTSTMPILEEVLARMEGDKLIMRATDLETHVETEMEVQTEVSMGLNGEEAAPEEVTLPVSRIRSTLSALPDVPVKASINEDYQIRMETDQGSYQMAGQDGQDFPDLPAVSVEDEVEAEAVMDAIEKVDFAVGDDALRPAMEGVFLDGPNNAVVATDGHRLSKVDTEVPMEDSAILTQSGVSLMKRLAPEEAILKVGEAWAMMEGERTRVYAKLIDESYPNYGSVIPNNDKTLVVDRESLLGATKRAGIYSSSTTNQIRFSVQPDRITIQAEDVERSSEATETLTCDFDGEAMDIGFNAKYLEEVLKNAAGEEIKMLLGSPQEAAVIRPMADEDHLLLIMPVML